MLHLGFQPLLKVKWKTPLPAIQNSELSVFLDFILPHIRQPVVNPCMVFGVRQIVVWNFAQPFVFLFGEVPCLLWGVILLFLDDDYLITGAGCQDVSIRGSRPSPLATHGLWGWWWGPALHWAHWRFLQTCPMSSLPGGCPSSPSGHCESCPHGRCPQCQLLTPWPWWQQLLVSDVLQIPTFIHSVFTKEIYCLWFSQSCGHSSK